MARLGFLLVTMTAVELARGQLLGRSGCSGQNRAGRRMKWKPSLPSNCLRRAHQGGDSAALCDEPGDDYPWEAIEQFLIASSEVARKRIDDSLKAAGVSRNSLRRRRTRSSDVNPDDDVIVAGSEQNEVTSARRRESSRPPPPPPPNPTSWEVGLDDFTETVYATATYPRPGKANVTQVAATTMRPTTTTPETTTVKLSHTPDPYTESACAYSEEVRSPFYAMNTRMEWKTLINMPNYENFIHMEHCEEEKSQGRCSPGCRCTQKQTIRTLPVYGVDTNGCDVIYMDKFLFNSHCDCKCRPAHIFRVPEQSTTEVPSSGDKVKVAPSMGDGERLNLTAAPLTTTEGTTVRSTTVEGDNEGMAMPDELQKASATTRRPTTATSTRLRPQKPPATRPPPTVPPKKLTLPELTQVALVKQTSSEEHKASSHTPPLGAQPRPVTARPGVPLPTRRRRPVPPSRATQVPRHTPTRNTLAPRHTREPAVPPRRPIVPSDAPVLNHRNRLRGPQTPPLRKRQP